MLNNTMTNLKIRKFRETDLPEVAMLISDTFTKYNRTEATPEGLTKYQEYYNSSNPKLLKSFVNQHALSLSIEMRLLVWCELKGTD